MPKLISLQLLRGIAAMMVLVGHVLAEAEHYMGQPVAFSALPWTRGVDLFFVISGFIIMFSGHKWFGIAGATRSFLMRRFIRVVPLYFFFTTSMVLALLSIPGKDKDTDLEVGQILTSYLFLPWMREDGRVAPVLSLGWTLNYEIFFYLLFASFLTLNRPIGPTVTILSIIVLGLIGMSFTPQTILLAFWLNPIVIEFAFGATLAKIWISRPEFRIHHFWLGLVIMIAGFVLLFVLNLPWSGLPRFVASGVPALIIVTGPLFCWTGVMDQRLIRFGIILGDSSYALYLSHRFVLRLLTIVLLPVLPFSTSGAWLFVTLACTLASIVGVLVFRHIETPMIFALNRLLLTPRQTGQA